MLKKVAVFTVIAFLFTAGCQEDGSIVAQSSEVQIAEAQTTEAQITEAGATNIQAVENQTIENQTIENQTIENPTINNQKHDTLSTGESSEWMKYYYEVMEKSADEATHITLTDVDFDGIPELFLSRLGASNSWIFCGYSFKKGSFTEIEIPGEFMPGALELYKDKKTDETIWLANGMFRDVDTYEYIWNRVDFSDFSNVKQSLFFGWNETLYGQGTSCVLTYQLLGEDSDDRTVKKEEIEQLEKAAFSDYDRIDTLSMFSFIDAFQKKDGTNGELDRELFYSFAKLYEEENHPTPVFFIFNFNISHQYDQITRYPVSVIRKDYRRVDENERTDIMVGCAELNNFPDQGIRLALNTRLREEAFGDWDVDKERDISLSIWQAPCFYRNYISVRTWTDCYMLGSTHPWSSLSAITFDMETGRELSLADMINVDDSLHDKILEGAFKTEKFTHEECIEYEIYDMLWDALKRGEPERLSNYYLTDLGRLGLIIGVPHMMGDYLTFEAVLDDLYN